MQGIAFPYSHREGSRRFDGRTYRVVYLEDAKRDLINEAISIDVVSGNDVGWHEALDARPIGAWLGIPFRTALSYIGLFGARYNKRNRLQTTALDEPPGPATE